MPNQSFEECYVSEDVTIQQITLVTIVVHQSHGNWVGVAHSFTGYRGIAPLDVIDRLVRRGGQGIGDDTFVLVGFQQFLRSMRIGCVHTEFQPRLQLRIQIDTGAITFEVRSDDGTVLIHIVGTDIILNGICTTLCTHLMLVLKGGAEDGILPVGTLT